MNTSRRSALVSSTATALVAGLFAAALSGCGLEAAGAATTAAGLAAGQAQQAKAQQERAVDKLKAAQDAGVAARAKSEAD